MLNLLPQPRSVVLGTGTVAAMEPQHIVDTSLLPQGYRLVVAHKGATIAAPDPAGAFYGQCTFEQLIRLHGNELPALEIEDWPDLQIRGVMLDVSRDKVPTVATLKDLVARLAGLKVNQLMLYMEHTFAYAGHERVWANADPFTADEIFELERFCRDVHVELVPCQNCLGHMDRWLRHDRYLPLALLPDGWTEQNGTRRSGPPTTLDPDNPASLQLIGELLSQLLPCFASSRVHVGLDEPFDMNAALVEELIDDLETTVGTWNRFQLAPRQLERYLSHLKTLRLLPVLEGKEMLVWGDVFAAHPEKLQEVPEGVTICEWGYEADHPFDERCATLRGADLPVWVCPGTSSWLSLGRPWNAIANLRSAAEAALEHGAGGYLNTDWGDWGHHQYLPLSEPGFAYGAAVSWCLETNHDLDLAAALDTHVFLDPTGTLGATLLELGEAQLIVSPQLPNMSTLTIPLYLPHRFPEVMGNGRSMDTLGEAEARITAAAAKLDWARPARDDGELVVRELKTAAALHAHLARDARARAEAKGTIGSVPWTSRQGLAESLAPILQQHRELWLARNRPGGLHDSLAWLEVLLRSYTWRIPA